MLPASQWTVIVSLALLFVPTCAFLSASLRPSQSTTAVYFEMPEYKDGSDYAMDNRDINNILEQNKAYVEALGPAFFEDLGAKNEPKYMWIGCSDARAPVNELMVSMCFVKVYHSEAMQTHIYYFNCREKNQDRCLSSATWPTW